MRKSILLLVSLLLCSICYSQDEGKKAKVGLGVFYHYEGTLPTVAFEYTPVRRISMELSYGMWSKTGDRSAFSPMQDARSSQFALSADIRLYLLLNRRNPLEGISIVGHIGQFRSRIVGRENQYLGFRNIQNELGFGIGGQYYILPRFSIGLTTFINHVWVTDYHLNEDGSIRLQANRPGFLFMGFLQTGYTF